MTTHSDNHPQDLALDLPATGTWPKAGYLLDGRSQDAIALAVACGRPLLVRGLPGTGKSDLARAAAYPVAHADSAVVTVMASVTAGGGLPSSCGHRFSPLDPAFGNGSSGAPFTSAHPLGVA
jgi:hypothetical protein